MDMTALGLIGPLGWQELLVIGVIMLLLFGRRLPEVGKSLGQGIVQFKKGLRDVEDEVKSGMDEEKARFDAAKTPFNSGQDQRVSQSQNQPEPVEKPAADS